MWLWALICSDDRSNFALRNWLRNVRHQQYAYLVPNHTATTARYCVWHYEYGGVFAGYAVTRMLGSSTDAAT